MNKYIFLITAFILDFLFLNIFPFEYQQISYIYPMFMITTVFLIYSLFNDDKKYYQVIVPFSIIYGATFLNNILLGIFLFLIVGFISRVYHKYIHLNILTVALGVFIVILIYDSTFCLLLNLAQVSNFSLNVLLYKLKHSLLLNIVRSILIYQFCIKNSSKSLI